MIWAKFFKINEKIENWNYLCDDVISSSNQLMSNFLIIIFKNITIKELSESYKTDDYFSLIYHNLTKLYRTKKYLKDMSKYLITKESNMVYNCLDFYQSLNNKNYLELSNRFANQSEEFIFTMFYFCNTTKIMIFKNYKMIYLQLFNQAKIVMENFTNIDYNDIIEYFVNIDIVEIEIIYLITYTYLLDLMSENIKHLIIEVMETMKNRITVSSFIFFILLVILIFIIYFLYIRNVSKDTMHFIHIRKVFKICNTNE